MGTIEKAREYARNGMSLYMDTSDEQDIYCEDLIQAYLAGAKSEREELIRWHDPKEELPPIEKVVLVKLNFGRGYALADRGDEGWWYADSEEWEISDEQVIGWREIHDRSAWMHDWYKRRGYEDYADYDDPASVWMWKSL